MGIAKDGGFEENFLFVDSYVYLCMYLSLSLYQQRSLCHPCSKVDMNTVMTRRNGFGRRPPPDNDAFESTFQNPLTYFTHLYNTNTKR
jgi:hypothetical protein